MLCIHITPEDNLNSIKKLGLLPTKSFLHSSSMKASFKTNKVIYLTLLESKKRILKFIEDFIYCKIWIYPRINFMSKNKINSETKEEEVYKHRFILKPKYFSILLTDFIPRKKWMEATHEQAGFFGQKDIDERFTHKGKPLIITTRKIESNRLNEIGRAYPVIRNNRIQNVKLEGWQ